jgi:hypothetical protein
MFADMLDVVLLGATAVVAGLGVVRPVAGPPGPTARMVAWWAAGIAVVLAVPLGMANVLMMAGHVAATLTVPAVLHRRVGAFLAGAVLTAILVLETSVVDPVVTSAYTAGWVVILGAVLTIVMADRESRAVRAHRLVPVAIVAFVVSIGFGLSHVLVPTPHHASPMPGAPLLSEVHLAGEHLPVLLTPQRPGRNLVLVGGAADGVRVGVDPENLKPVEERAGADGMWATVDLPPAASTLWIGRGDDLLSIPVDTGHGKAAAPEVTGADGPECASTALGATLAGHEHSLTSCPADSLPHADEASLRGLVDFLAVRGVRAITVAGDGSDRSSAAVAVVHEAAARNRMPVVTDSGSDGALVVVAGWEAASTTLSAAAYRQRTDIIHGAGIYLAPWLLSAAVIRPVGGTVIPLRFDPRDEQPVNYKLALATRFHGLNPTASGYQGWLSATGSPEAGPTRMYSASLVSFLPKDLGTHNHDHNGDWLPGGTVVGISGTINQG